MMDKMKTIKITPEIYYDNLEKSHWFDDDNECFGENIDGKFYLYFKNENDEFYLIILDQELQYLLCSSSFVSKLAVTVLDRNPKAACEFCTFIADCICDNFCFDNMPFELRDIVYSVLQ